MVKPVDIKNPYVYLDYLKNTNAKVWDDAVNAVESAVSNIKQADAEGRIQNSITFLQTIANNEIKKEQKFIQTRIKDLQQANIKDPRITKLNQRMTSLLNNISNGVDYHEFTSILNETLSVQNEYKSRLIAMKNNLQKQAQGQREQMTLLTGIDQEFINTLKFLERGSRTLGAKYKKFSAIMPSVMFDYIDKNKKQFAQAAITSSPARFAAAILRLQLGFRAWLEDNDDLKDPIGADVNARLDTLSVKFDKFMQQQNLTWFLNDTTELDRLAMVFNFKNDIPISKRRKSKPISFSAPKILQFNTQPIAIFKGDFSQYSVAEYITLATKNYFSGKRIGYSNMGNDVILGYIHASYSFNTQEAQDAMDQAIDQVAEAIDDFSKERQDRDNYRAYNELMNYEIQNALEQLNESMETNQAEGFFIHESTKYYETLETGEKYSKSNNLLGFKGRSLSLLNYIDVMYNIGLDFGIDVNNLYFIGLNLGAQSPAAGMTSTLEFLFTIAASLIMFDDVSVIIKEAAETISFSSLTNLHLYNLQGVYVPASYIINESIKYLRNLNTSTDAATTTISVPTQAYKNYADSFSQDKRSEKMKSFLQDTSENRWEKMKSVLSSQTKVSIHFFLNFQNFINNLK